VLGGATRQVRGSVLDAQRDRPIRIRQRGQVDVSGVRFHAAGLAAFCDAPLDAWNNRLVPVGKVFGRDALDLSRGLRDAAGDTGARAQLLDAFLAARLVVSPALQTLWALKSRIEAQRGLIRIEDACARERVSMRQAARLFRRHLGFTPKAFARIVRFQRALRLLGSETKRSVAYIAARAGYYDQPHFVRECKQLCGQIPRRQLGYFPTGAPSDFSPNLVQFLQDRPRDACEPPPRRRHSRKP
jgi:AraC-like DNA-binding protein